MNSQNDQTGYAGGSGAAFSFDRRQNGMRFSADLGRLCQQVGEQVHNAVAGIDFEGIGDEVRRAMMDVGNEVREAVDNFNREQQRAGSTRVNVDVDIQRERAVAAAPSREQAALVRERTAVLQMVAEGKITPDQAERLLNALGG